MPIGLVFREGLEHYHDGCDASFMWAYWNSAWSQSNNMGGRHDFFCSTLIIATHVL
jgi:hypothetical protein